MLWTRRHTRRVGRGTVAGKPNEHIMFWTRRAAAVQLSAWLNYYSEVMNSMRRHGPVNLFRSYGHQASAPVAPARVSVKNVAFHAFRLFTRS